MAAVCVTFANTKPRTNVNCPFAASLLRLQSSLKSFCMNHQHLPCAGQRAKWEVL